jgi:ParB-like chromosome segregation protein Spo0J
MSFRAPGMSAADRSGSRPRSTSGSLVCRAARRLGRDTIPAILRDIDDDQALLAEIDENLIRADLSPAERALHIARRKELYEKIHPDIDKHGGDRKSAEARSSSQVENLKSFIDALAAMTGKGRSTLARDVTRGNEVVVLSEIIGTSLDKGDEIDALAKLPEDEQRVLADAAKAGELVSAKAAVAKKPRTNSSLARSAKRKAAKQLKRFLHATFIIRETCSSAEMVAVPDDVSEENKDQSLKDLSEAIAHLRKFKAEIEKTRRAAAPDEDAAADDALSIPDDLKREEEDCEA